MSVFFYRIKHLTVKGEKLEIKENFVIDFELDTHIATKLLNQVKPRSLVNNLLIYFEQK